MGFLAARSFVCTVCCSNLQSISIELDENRGAVVASIIQVENRINVALTRARHGIFIVGNAELAPVCKSFEVCFVCIVVQ